MSTPPEPDRAGDARATTLNESWDLVRRSTLGRLAVIHDGEPDIFPVNHAVEHGTVVFRTTGGTKHSAALGSRVAFEVDGYDPDTEEAWSVVLRGTAKEVSDVDDVIAVLGMGITSWQEGNKPHFLRVLPDTVTGRRFRVSEAVRRSAGQEGGPGGA